MLRHCAMMMALLALGSLAAGGRAEPPALPPGFPILLAEDAKPAEPAPLVGTPLWEAVNDGPRPWQLLLGYRTWFSWGNAEDLAFGNSLFKFRDTYSTVYEFNADAAWNRLVGRVDLGFGSIDDGYFQDEDTFTSTSDPQFPLLEDDLFYVTVDGGFRLFCRGDLRCRGCALDVLAGYQYWRETYVPVFTDGSTFSDTYTWNSARVGVRGLLSRNRLFLQGRFMVVPYAHFQSETDSFLIEADGSWGVMSDFSASYRVWRDLSLELGYQVFYLDSGPGDIDGQPDFQGARHVRHGILLGAHWRF